MKNSAELPGWLFLACALVTAPLSEGIAVFQKPDGKPHRWLTREYGCFGPRRPDETSGRPFRLRKGKSLSQSVMVLVHRGNAASGRIAERYRKWLDDGGP